MNIKAKWVSALAGFALGILLFAASCAPTMILYSVTGSAPSASVVYRNASGGTSQVAGVKLPWFYRMKWTWDCGECFLSIIAQNESDHGTVTVNIWANATLLKTSTSEGAYVSAAADVTWP